MVSSVPGGEDWFRIVRGFLFNTNVCVSIDNWTEMDVVPAIGNQDVLLLPLRQ